MKRAAGKEKRRQQVLAAVEDSIRSAGAVDFSMRELADKAQVSFATPFNLFGSKEEILAALFNKRVTEQALLTAERAGNHEAVENLLYIAVESCDAYLADAELFRPLMQGFRPQGSSQFGSVSQQALDLWAQALQRCQQAKMLTAAADIEALARRLHLSFRMAFWMWAAEHMDNSEFRQHALFATVACVLPAATPKGQKRINELLNSDPNLSA